VTAAGQDRPLSHEAAGFRVTWLPGSDQLHGACHCGADRVSEDPIDLWTWLYDHPVGHLPAQEPVPDDTSPHRSRALVPMPVGITT
jgi:hypothetical protein